MLAWRLTRLTVMTSVAVVVPLYRSDLTPDEVISFRHLDYFLGAFDIVLCVPENLRVSLATGRVIRFPDRYFQSVATYSQLLLSRRFYEALGDYRHILIYQLDCLVFSNRLLQWCDLGYDYLGAPLFSSKTDSSKGFSRVGNGGLSLRRVESFLKVLDSKRYAQEPDSILHQMFTAYLPDLDPLPLPKRWVKKLRVLWAARRGVQDYLSNYSLNEDLFWSDRARLFDSGFRISPVEIALGFAFDMHPRYCYEHNGCKLPFGCHAWGRRDREFWEPHLLPLKQEGSDVALSYSDWAPSSRLRQNGLALDGV